MGAGCVGAGEGGMELRGGAWLARACPGCWLEGERLGEGGGACEAHARALCLPGGSGGGGLAAGSSRVLQKGLVWAGGEGRGGGAPRETLQCPLTLSQGPQTPTPSCWSLGVGCPRGQQCKAQCPPLHSARGGARKEATAWRSARGQGRNIRENAQDDDAPTLCLKNVGFPTQTSPSPIANYQEYLRRREWSVRKQKKKGREERRGARERGQQPLGCAARAPLRTTPAA